MRLTRIWLSLGLLFAGCQPSPALAQALAEYEQAKEEEYIAVIITEAGGEPFEGQVGVAEVLRNRGWNTQGFCGLRGHQLAACRDPVLRSRADRAITQAKNGSAITKGATHFENIEAFGWPKWSRGMVVTAKIGHHTFMKKKQKTMMAAK